MPRFGLSQEATGFAASSGSPLQQQQQQQYGGGGEDSGHYYQTPNAAASFSPHRTPAAAPPTAAAYSSVCLSCQSPDGKSWHSLVLRNGAYVIETKFLCSSEDEEDQETNAQQQTVVTPLPQLVQSVLRVDAPCELLCVGGGGAEIASKTYDNDDDKPEKKSLPSLCLYASRAVFLLDIVYSNSNDSTSYSNTIPGEVLSLTEPFERHLLDSSFATRIVRIRPAPARATLGNAGGGALHSPPNCMAMLTEDREASLYQLALLESNGSMTIPSTFQTEHLGSSISTEERIVDFCFAQCTGLSLLASLSVLFVKGSGDVLAATPIVFDGAIVPRPDYQQALDYIRAAKKEYNSNSNSNPTNAAKWRQCRAAEQYLLDVFPSHDTKSYFLTAKTLNVAPQAAASWPVQIQGPVLFQSQTALDAATQDDPPALTIEAFGSAEMVGLAVGREQAAVDIGVVSPTTLIPRFSLEARRDTYMIDDDVFYYSSWVERVALGMEEESVHYQNAKTSSACRIRLLRDSAVDTFLHVVIPSAVCTISTNAVQVASRHLMGGQGAAASARSDPVKTNAWTCLMNASTSNTTSIQGAVVTDSSVGHNLLVRLADGSTTETNVDEQRYAHDLSNMMTASNDVLVPSSKMAASSNEALQRLDAVPPFCESVQPLVQQIQSGLASMGKIVGSETPYRDITPDTLAVVAAVKERSDREIVLPLLELKKMLDSRRAALRHMAQTQQEQLNALLETVTDMQERTNTVCARVEVAQTNALTLSQRAEAAMQSSQGLGPVISRAESEFFKFVNLTSTKCNAWEEKAKELTDKAKQQVESLQQSSDDQHGDGAIQLNLDELDAGKFRALLKNNGALLKRSRERLKETERRIQALVRKAGLEDKEGGEEKSSSLENKSSNVP